MIIGRDLLTALGLDLKLSENIVFGSEGPYEKCSTPMVYVSNCDFKILTEKIKRKNPLLTHTLTNEMNPKAQ